MDNNDKNSLAEKRDAELKKASEGAKKIKKLFFQEDLKSTIKHMFTNVIVPSIKRTFNESVSKGVAWMLYGQNGTPITNGSRNVPYVNYTSYYSQPMVQKQQPPSIQATPANSLSAINNIIFTEYGDARLVLQQMTDIVNRYGVVSITDFYDAVKTYTGNPNIKSDYTGGKYGWRNLNNAKIVDRGGGTYSIEFPTVVLIDS